MAGPTTEDKAKDIGWNILTGIPAIGTVASGADMLYNAGKLAGPGQWDKETRDDATRNIASDCISILPAIGTASSILGVGYDILASNDTWGNLTGQLMGGPDAYGPSPGEENY